VNANSKLGSSSSLNNALVERFSQGLGLGILMMVTLFKELSPALLASVVIGT